MGIGSDVTLISSTLSKKETEEAMRCFLKFHIGSEVDYEEYWVAFGGPPDSGKFNWAVETKFPLGEEFIYKWIESDGTYSEGISDEEYYGVSEEEYYGKKKYMNGDPIQPSN